MSSGVSHEGVVGGQRAIDRDRKQLDALGTTVLQARAAGTTEFEFEIRRKPVHLVLLNAADHELPIYLGFGGFNDCPMPHAIAGVLRYWARNYKTRLAYIGQDTLELQLQAPPRTLSSIKELAWQQYEFCQDVVDQGTGTVASLGRTLVRDKWLFWWD
jgi:hypothetical protein